MSFVAKHRFINSIVLARVALLAGLVLAILLATAAVAGASEGEERRINTANVTKSTEIEPVAEDEPVGETQDHEEGVVERPGGGVGDDGFVIEDGISGDDPFHKEGDSADDDGAGKTEADEEHDDDTEPAEEGKDDHAEEGKDAEEGAGEHGEEGEEGEEEVHHPAWMIPGWQSIFTILAVVYFALGVTILPRIMAKEEDH